MDTKLFKKIYQMIEENDHAGALSLLEDLDESAAALKLKGRIKHLGGNSREALEMFSRALELDPSDGELSAEYARLLKEQKDYDRALEYFEKALQNSFDNPELRYDIALVYLEKGELEHACRELEAAEKITQDKLVFIKEKARIRIRQERFKDAGKIFKKALENYPDDAELMAGMANIKKVLGFPAQAAEYYKKAADAGYNSAGIHYDMAMAYLADSRYEEAYLELDRAEKLGADPFLCLKEKGFIKHEQAFYEEAEELYKQALEIEPESGELHLKLGRLYKDLFYNERALKHLRQAAASGCDGHSIRYDMALVCIESGLYEDALKELDAAAEYGFNKVEILRKKGLVCQQQRLLQEAESYFKEALELSPENISLHRALAKVYIDSADYGKALKKLLAALRYKKDDPALCSEIGCLYYFSKIEDESGEEALKYFRQAVKNKDKASGYIHDENYHYSMGIAYLCLKNYEDSLAELGLVLEINPSSDALRYVSYIYSKTRPKKEFVHKNIEYTERKLRKDKEENAAFEEFCRNYGGKKRKKKKLRIKILRLPFFADRIVQVDHPMIIPYGIASITGYLRENGMDIAQDDLNIKINNVLNKSMESPGIDRNIFLDKERIYNYYGGSDDPGMVSCFDQLQDPAEIKKYDVILLSVPEDSENSSGILFTIAYSRYLKDLASPMIVIGGFNTVFLDVLRGHSGYMDHIIIGEGEKVLYKLLTASSYSLDPAKIPGFIMHDKKILEESLKLCPVKADFSGLPIKKYGYAFDRFIAEADDETKDILKDFNSCGTVIATFKLINNCHANCIFCACSNQNMVEVSDTGRIVENISALKKETGISSFFFLDDCLNVSRDYVSELSSRIIDAGLDIMWSDCARPDNLDQETLLSMREAGCIRLVYGMEAGSQKLLNFIHKGLNIDHVEKVLKWSDKAGIWNGLETIYGFPYETIEDIESLLDFLQRNRKYINTVYYNILRLTADSELYNNPEKYGIENIRPVDFTEHELSGILRRVTNGFDEVNGLKWEDKIKQSIYSFNYVRSAMKDEVMFPEFEEEHFLFFLYSRFSDKKEISRVYNKTRSYITSQISSFSRT